jgi:hypothetical protein
MPLVRLIIFIFRGIGGIFRAIGRMFRALFSAGMFGFLAKSFEVILRIGFIASIVAAATVCYNLSQDAPYAADSRVMGPPYSCKVDTFSSYVYHSVTVSTLLNDFRPKDPKVSYGPGKLDAEGLIKVWMTEEMNHKTGQKVSWTADDPARPTAPGRLILEPDDFAPRSWTSYVRFFEATWAILTLPIVVAFLIFPSASGFSERLRRACLTAPLCAIVSFSFAYLLARHWLSLQHQAMAELIVDLPRWVQPSATLSKSILAGAAISILPIACWYLLRWVLGPLFAASSARQNP